MSGQCDIRLLLADVDGTLVTQDKVLTEAAKAVARELHHAGIILAITSGRPPRGMSVQVRSPASTAACSPGRTYPSSIATLSTPPQPDRPSP